MEKLLELTDLVISYGPIDAVKKVNMQVEKGQIVALLGANGAGKSSLIKAIAGVVKPSHGAILYEGNPINNLPIHHLASSGIVTSPEGRLVFKDLTVEENLLVGAYGLKDTAEISAKARREANFKRVYKYFPVLLERKSQLAATLSGGEQQMLAIGRALMASPKLLLLDEPSLGLAPLIVKSIFEIIKQISSEGTTILIVEQNAYQTLKIAHYAYVLELGKIKAHGVPADLLKDETLLSAYLGG